MDYLKDPAFAAKGLDAQAVERSRQKHGSNRLTQQKRKHFGSQFLANFGDPIIKILLVALFLNVLLLFRQANWFETAGIALAVFLATFVSTLSEYGSESAFLRLQQEASRGRCRALRDGKIQQIPVDDVVVGDLILLEGGERIPADGLLAQGKLSVDQSALNGESRETQKLPGSASPGEQDWDFSRQNQLFRGSVVCQGQGMMQALRVGDATFYGGMAREMQQETRQSPLKLRLSKLADTLSRLGFLAAMAVGLADLFNALVIDNGFSPNLILAALADIPHLLNCLLHAATLAVTVMVVAAPEGLPMMITVALSSNMRRMLRDKVLVRKLVGVETSGSLNILFTDKTGTLTQGKLAVTEFVSGAGHSYDDIRRLAREAPELFRLVGLGCTANTQAVLDPQGKPLGGNATDRALLAFVAPCISQIPQLSARQTVAFDSALKFSTAQVSQNGRPLSLIKGAPELILNACTHYLDSSGRRQPLPRMSAARAAWEQMTAGAFRVLALAYAEKPVEGKGDLNGLTLLGLTAIQDKLRPQAPAAVAQAQRAGVQVVMITGDNKDTAVAIARQAGLLKDPQDLALTHDQLAALSDEQVIEIMPRLRAVARALPQDKSRLVRLAQQMGLVAGMTGDGINDAPALKLADVGFAMGGGTEVAKEAGDIVILDDNFASLTRAILYGRTIFKSIRKFIVFQLTMNLCAVGVSIFGPFFGVDAPITVVQMLWVNIIMDTLAGLAYAGEPPLPETMEEPPKRRDEPIFTGEMLGQALYMGGFTIILCLALLTLPFFRQALGFAQNPDYLLTVFFTFFIFCGIFNSFNARTPRLNLLAHLKDNPTFAGVMLTVSLIQGLLIYFGGSLFRANPLEPRHFLLAVLAASSVIPADLLRKLALRRLRRLKSKWPIPRPETA